MIPDARIEVVVAVVTWRAADLTIGCLASVAEEIADHPDLRLIVVDNASGDDTADRIEAAIRERGWSDWAELLRSPRNGGFAAGNNLVVRQAFARYPAFRQVLLLNPDTVVRRGAIAELRRFMAEEPRAGIVGGRCEDPDSTPQVCAFRFPGVMGEFAAQLRLGVVDRLLRRWLIRIDPVDAPLEVGWVAGALMMVRREVFERIGLMDESYFLYYEETDFSLRARRAGWPTWHAPASRAIHFVGQVTGVTARGARPKRLPAYWFESRRRYFVLNHGLAYAVLVDCATIMGSLLWGIRRMIQRRPAIDPPCWIRDLVTRGPITRGSANLPDRITR
jgi:N-acetylglucosaminyl-diphospho-decaprenol L-rhamnosyltransferase